MRNSLTGWIRKQPLLNLSTSPQPVASTPPPPLSPPPCSRGIKQLEEGEIIDLLCFEKVLHAGPGGDACSAQAFLLGVMPPEGRASRRPLLFFGSERRSGHKVVIKVIDKLASRVSHRTKLRALCKKILNLPYHPLLLTIYDIYEDAERWYIITEILAGTELYMFLQHQDHVPEELCKHIIRQILLALEFLHLHNVVHRDVKPENLVFRLGNDSLSWPTDPPGKSTHTAARQKVDEYLAQFELVLIDMDTSKLLDDEEPPVDQNGVRKPPSIVGTYNYMAPEVLCGAECSPSRDLWGVGMILYLLMTGGQPFAMGEMRSVQSSIAVHQQVARSGGISFDVFPLNNFTGAQSLCRELLQPDPQKRLKSATEALRHPWLASSAHLSSAYYLASMAKPIYPVGPNKGKEILDLRRALPKAISPLSNFTLPNPIPEIYRRMCCSAAQITPSTPRRKSRRYKEISALSTAAQEDEL